VGSEMCIRDSGCIFSEHERYRDTSLHVYKGSAADRRP